MLVLTIVVGLLLALLFSEAFRLYPGGFIVPVYFAYYLDPVSYTHLRAHET